MRSRFLQGPSLEQLCPCLAEPWFVYLTIKVSRVLGGPFFSYSYRAMLLPTPSEMRAEQLRSCATALLSVLERIRPSLLLCLVYSVLCMAFRHRVGMIWLPLVGLVHAHAGTLCTECWAARPRARNPAAKGWQKVC